MEKSNDFTATMDRFYQLFSDLIDESSDSYKNVDQGDLNWYN